MPSSVPRQEQDSKDEPFALSQSLIFAFIRSHDTHTSACPDPHILRPATPDLHRKAPAARVLMGMQQTFPHLYKVGSIQAEAGARCCKPGHWTLPSYTCNGTGSWEDWFHKQNSHLC